MPTLSFTVTYDGSDSEIAQRFSRMIAAYGFKNGELSTTNAPSSSANVSPGWTENVAAKFAGFVSQTAMRGEKSQKNVIETWLKHNGSVPLTELVKASGVKRAHDYSGVGSSLSRNMKKSGGPKRWYDVVRNTKGERIYKMAPELIEPLKRIFKV